MRRSISTGILCGVAFTTLGLAAERAADACQHVPPPEPDGCAIQQDGDTTYVAVATETYGTTQHDCGCGTSVGNLAQGATVGAAGFFDASGNATTAFCAAGLEAKTTTAFQLAFPGANLSAAALAALSTTGIIPNQRNYAAFRIDNNPSGQLPDTIALAQVNFLPDGTNQLDSAHQALAAIDPQMCTKCDVTPNTQACIALANARTHLGVTPFVAKQACAHTEAPLLLGLPPADDSGGCNATAGGGALLGFVGFALMFARRGRRA